MDGPEAVRACVRELVQVGRTLSEEEIVQCQQISKAAHRVLRRHCLDLIEEHPQAHTMVAYMCDGWAGPTRSAAKVSLAAGGQLFRHDHSRVEYHLEHAFVRLRTWGGRDIMGLIASEARPMTAGRKAWNVFGARADFLPPLRKLGARGIVISWVVMDGALFSAARRQMRAAHQARYDIGLLGGRSDDEGGGDVSDGDAVGEPDVEAKLAEWSDWDLYMKCKAHGMQNSIAWGFKPWASADCLSDAHLTVKGYMTNSKELRLRVDAFMMQYVEFVARSESQGDRETWWTFLGVPSSWLRIFAQADPFWDGQRVRVNASLLEHVNCWEELRKIFLFAFRWRSWSDTRWLNCGKSSRSYVCARACGVDGMIKTCLADPACPKSYMKSSHARSCFAVRRFFAIVAVMACPAEGAHAKLARDDRFLKFGNDMRNTVEAQIIRIAGFPELVWQRLSATVGDVSWTEMRALCQKATLRSCAYMGRDVFMDLDTPPHAITQGDIGTNLEKLSQSQLSDISDGTYRKIKQMMSFGVSTRHIKQAIQLWADAPGSVNSQEQVHGSAACIVRRHPTYSEDTLFARAGLHKLRNLFEPDRFAVLEARLQQRITKLKAKKPDATTGHNMFFAENAKREVMAETDGDVDNWLVEMSHKLQDHMRRWDDLPLQEKRRYEVAAQRHAARRKVQIAEAISELESDIEHLRHKRCTKHADGGVPNHYGARRFTTEELQRICDLLEHPSFSGMAISSDAVRRPPLMPPNEVQEELENLAQTLPAVGDGERGAPEWCRTICRNVDHWEDVALGVDSEDSDVVYLLAYVTLDTHSATFVELRRSSVAWSRDGVGVDGEDEDRWFAPEGRREYVYTEPFRVLTEQQLPIDTNIHEVWVHQHMHVEGHLVTTNSTAREFADFCRGLPPPPRASAPRSARQRRKTDIDQALADHPWLEREDLELPRTRPASGGCGPTPGARGASGSADAGGSASEAELGDDDGDGASEDDSAPEDAIDEADLYRELAEVRVGVGNADETFYRVVVLGGKWTKKKKKLAADAVMGAARHGNAARWAAQFSFPKSKRFHFPLYGIDNAKMLAREFARRGNFFCFMWHDSGLPLANFNYTQAMVDSYVESAEYLDWAIGLDVDEPSFDKMVEIRRLVPVVT